LASENREPLSELIECRLARLLCLDGFADGDRLRVRAYWSADERHRRCGSMLSVGGGGGGGGGGMAI